MMMMMKNKFRRLQILGIRYIKTFQIKNLRSGMFYKCD
jgi:hypothetical protein